MALLELKNVSKQYLKSSKGLLKTNLLIQKGSKTAIIGETGSGKSTLLRLMAGLEQPDTGSILFKGTKVQGPEDQLVPGHTEIAYLSQHFELPRFITIEQYLYDPYEISLEDVQKIYVACRITHLLTADTGQLSGGERQRVALAKAIIKSPEILLLDEPFSNLDLSHKRIIKEVIFDLEKELDSTIVLVSHDPLDVLAWADEIVVLKTGKIIQKAAPLEVYDYPIDEHTAGLFGSFNLINPADWGKSSNNTNDRNGKVIIRPERFQLSKSSNGIKGKVIRTMYFGSYDEVFVETNKDIIVVKAEAGLFKSGDQVAVTLKKQQPH